MLAKCCHLLALVDGSAVFPRRDGASSEAIAERRVLVSLTTNLNVRCEQPDGEAESGIYAVICDISCAAASRSSRRAASSRARCSAWNCPRPKSKRRWRSSPVSFARVPHGDSEWTMGCRFRASWTRISCKHSGLAPTGRPRPILAARERFDCDAKAVYQRVSGDCRLSARAAVEHRGSWHGPACGRGNRYRWIARRAELHDATGQRIITILACVVHVQKVAEGQKLGCNFIRELNDKDLRRL